MNNIFEKDNFNELCNIISNSQEVKLYQPIVVENKVTILEANRSNEILEAEGTVDIVFRFDNEKLIISNLYLKYKGKGTGSLIIVWLINFCKYNGINKISIRIVKKDNVIMNKLCKKFGFKRIDNDYEFNDYVLELNKGDVLYR